MIFRRNIIVNTSKFEHKLRRHKQRFGEIATTVVWDKDKNLLWSRWQWHRSCHSNEMTLLPCLRFASLWRTNSYGLLNLLKAYIFQEFAESSKAFISPANVSAVVVPQSIINLPRCEARRTISSCLEIFLAQTKILGLLIRGTQPEYSSKPL